MWLLILDRCHTARTAIAFVGPLHPHCGILIQPIDRGVLIPPIVGFDHSIIPVLLRLSAGVIAVNVMSVVPQVITTRHSQEPHIFQAISSLA